MNQDIGFGDKTLLLVEDELFLAEKTEQQLAALGMKAVLVAVSLADADRVLEEETVNLALLDVNLPKGETTLELGQRLSESGVPVVFFSGFDAAEMARLSKGHEFLEKPLSVSRLKASLQRAILRNKSGRSDKKIAGQEARQSG